jgi:hypothetical protein
MSKHLAKLLSVLTLSASLLLGQVGSIQAQGTDPIATPTSTKVAAEVSDPTEINFTMLRQTDIELVGPYDSNSFSFSLPADWKLKTGTQLELSMGISFDTLLQNQADQTYQNGGTLTVLLNYQVVGVIPLNQNGETKVTFPIVVERFQPRNEDQSLVITFVLSSGVTCDVNQHTNIFIHPESHFILPHESVKPDTNLTNFPRPIYQNLIIRDSALVVVANQPTAAEMQAALTVSAGLGNLSGNSLVLDLTTFGKLTNEQKKANHLIFVGKAASLSVLNELSLPLPINNNKFQITGGNPDDGVVQMINSPWSDAHVILVVSGNSDLGTVKAAQAVSTGVIQPNRAANLAVIDKVQLASTTASQAEDRTLADLGYKTSTVLARGANYSTYTFNIPPGYNLASEAYFDLVFGNSALLNYTRSGMIVQLNYRPIGSVRLSEVSADLAINKSRISIPSAALVPGRNVLQIITNLVPTDDCTPPGINQGLWANIWAESLLHLPLAATSITRVSTQKDLATYLPAFIYDPLLSEVAFVLPENNLDAWRSATQMASYLGNEARGSIVDLSVFYANAVPQAERSKYNFLVIGRPSELPILSELNKTLPVPFAEKSDIPSTTNFQVTYRISPETPLGYVQIMPSLWNSNHVVLAILGNSAQGIDWATKALTDSILKWRMGGNFALVNNHQIITTDTKLLPVGLASLSTQSPEEVIILPAVSTPMPNQIPATKPLWVLPALGVTLALIILVLAIAFITNRSGNRSQNKKG